MIVLKKRLVLITVLTLSVMPAVQSETKSAAMQQLVEKAESVGELSLIVNINIKFTSESELSSDRVTEQRSAISGAQSRIVDRIKNAGGSVKNHKHFNNIIPSMALTTDATGLRVLVSDPDVKSLEEDIAVPASLSGMSSSAQE